MVGKESKLGTNRRNAIVIGMRLQETHDIAIVHPRGNEAETRFKQGGIDTIKWKNVGMMELSPD